ncbi:hypothetical protein KI387_040864 [Taxus chinensis]|uniref:TIR domain-containing protein n=1 Tax=Taxus chinensis TaxID=29808 RepID=A0AA38C7H2_TAXCH|nr:hypothetical protein KI387_040864 [Taxus chinensis]
MPSFSDNVPVKNINGWVKFCKIGWSFTFELLLPSACVTPELHDHPFMASSSSSHSNAFGEIGPQCKRRHSFASPKSYDVFINHRGPDVKETLALELYNFLKRMDIPTFLDSREFELGDSIPSTIENVISSASVHIAIFSTNYANSPWCLDELDLMLQTKTRIIPIFYHVKPMDLRYTEKGAYADAFTTHTEKGRYASKIEKWKETLHSVSVICGYEFIKDDRNYKKKCKKIVYAARKEIEKGRPLPVAKSPVGLDEIVEDFENLCCKKKYEKSTIIGIFGMGGSGKTTLAKELFNRKRSEYNASCFLFDVREASAKTELPFCQSKLLIDLFQDKRKFQSIDEGSSYLHYRMERSRLLRFLIVVDDIDHANQLDALSVRDSLNSGSLLIITTRDEGVLKRSGITIRYKMKEMNINHGRELFCWHAFRRNCPVSGFEDLVESFVKVCGGLPLSLQVLGGLVFGYTDKEYWKSQLDKISKMLPGDIKHRLKISFDSLDSEEKQIFMDIACFFIGKDKKMAIRIWEGSGWSAKHALQTLRDRCLIMFDRVYETIWHDVFKMHDHLCDLARDMADQFIPRRLWQPQYLRTMVSKTFQNILMETNGRCYNSISDLFQITYFLGNSDDFAQTSSALLWLEISMVKEKHLSIPSWIPLQNLQCLRINGGCWERLWQSDAQAPLLLKELQLYYTSLEDQFPNSLGVLRNLEDLALFGMGWEGFKIGKFMVIEGRALSESLRNLTNLKSLVLTHLCVSGELTLNNSIDSTTFESPTSSLEKIDIRGVEALSKISISGEKCPSLKSLELRDITNLTEVHFTLNSVELRPCEKVRTFSGIPDLAEEGYSGVQELSNLESIKISKCWQLQNIIGIERLERLRCLYLSAGNGPIRDCIERLQRLPEIMTVNGMAANGAEKHVNANMFLGIIGGNAVSNINQNSLEEAIKSVNTKSLSAGIICLVIPSTYPEGYMSGMDCQAEDYVSTCMVTVQARIKSVWRMHFAKAPIKRGCIIEVNEAEEGKNLLVLKTIISKLY